MNLLHQGHNLFQVIRFCREYVEANLQVSFLTPRAGDVAYARKLLDSLYVHGIDDRLLEARSSIERTRQGRAQRLIEVLPCDWRGRQLVHHCKRGCCKSRSESVRKVWDAFSDVVFGGLPGIPAVKYWTKMRPCVTYFAVGMAVCGVMTRALLQQFAPHAGPHAAVQGVAAGDLATAPSDDAAAYQQVRGARARKASRFLNESSALARLIVGAVIIRPLERFLFQQFAESAQASGKGHGSSPRPLVDLSSRVTSPAVRAISELLLLLQDDPFKRLGCGLGLRRSRRG
eukprot:13091683-Alexandrium_andersonii.AAC.1